MCLSLFVIHKWLLCLIRLLIQFWFSSHPSPSTVREILANSQRVSFYGFLMAMTKSEEINQDIGESDNITCCIILLVYCHKSYCFRVVIIGCWVSCLSKQCSNRVVCIQFLFKLYLFYPLIWFSNFLFVFVFSFEEKSLKKIIIPACTDEGSIITIAMVSLIPLSLLCPWHWCLHREIIRR